MGRSFRLTARVLLYAPSHRQDDTYHGLCYTSSGARAGTRNSSMGPPWRIDPTTHRTCHTETGVPECEWGVENYCSNTKWCIHLNLQSLGCTPPNKIPQTTIVASEAITHTWNVSLSTYSSWIKNTTAPRLWNKPQKMLDWAAHFWDNRYRTRQIKATETTAAR